MENRKCEDNLSGKVWLQIIHTYNNIQNKINNELNNSDLTIPQMDLLATLCHFGKLNQQELAAKLLVTKGNICGLVDRVSEKGLVERKSCPDDRRINYICLTEAGESLIGKILPEHNVLLDKITEKLSDDESKILIELLKKISE